MEEACVDYAKFILTLGFCIPFSVILFCSFSILLRLRQLAKVRKMMKVDKNQVDDRERKVTYMILLMILAFFISWFFYALVCIMRVFGLDCPDYLVGLAVVSAKTGPWTNSIIFIFLQKDVINDSNIF